MLIPYPKVSQKRSVDDSEQQLGKKKKGEDRIFWIHYSSTEIDKFNLIVSNLDVYTIARKVCVSLLCGGVLEEEGQLSVPDVVDEAADTNRPGRTICSF